jgi:hypothetical protein
MKTPRLPDFGQKCGYYARAGDSRNNSCACTVLWWPPIINPLDRVKESIESIYWRGAPVRFSDFGRLWSTPLSLGIGYT